MSRAAGEYERIAAESDDPELRGEALLLAGDLYEQSKNRIARSMSIPATSKEFPRPVETAVETRFKIAEMYKAQHDEARYHEELRGDRAHRRRRRAASERTARALSRRGRHWSSRSSSTSASRRVEARAAVRASLQEKQQAWMPRSQAFGELVEYEVGEVTAAATFYMAEIYSTSAAR